MLVYASAPFRYQGVDYPYGWQDVSQSLGDILVAAGYVNTSFDPAGAGKIGPVVDLATLQSAYPAESNARRSAIAGGSEYRSDGTLWLPIRTDMGAHNSYVIFGDSIATQCGGPNIGGGSNLYDKSWTLWANAELGGRLTCVRNAGVSGDTTAMMLARLETDVKPYAPNARICIFNGGVNDPSGGSGGAGAILTFAQTKANLVQIVTRLLQLFDYVVWCSSTPYAGTATLAAQTSQIADFTRKTAPIYKRVLFLDNYGLTVNKTATTGALVTGYSNDATPLHPNCVGARVMGHGLATVLTPYLTGSAPLPPTQANTVANMTATYATQVLPNPLLVNNGGTITGTNVTSAGSAGLAGAPSDWTVRAGTSGNYSDGTTAVTCQLVQRADSVGNSLQLVMSAGSNTGTPLLSLLTASHHTEVSSGQTVQIQCMLSMSGASNIKNIVIYLWATDSNGTVIMTALQTDGVSTFSQSDFTDYVFKSTPYTLGSNVTNLRFRIDIAGVDKTAAATFKLSAPVIDILPGVGF